MSYDYWLVRLRSPVYKTHEFDEPLVEDFSQWTEVRQSIATVLPDIIWRDTENEFYGDGEKLRIGRFEVCIRLNPAVNEQYNRPYGMFWVHGSHYVNQRDYVLDIAKAVDFSVLDFQINEVLYLQKIFGEYRPLNSHKL